ncbi:protease-4 [Pustulibacterium marinum]|uniref:Protease-4 n=1 Tax=Pustulibacterium marinum TaxID=1224947 RepID=A0A1I7GKQ3_9FLAO|nr:S49 family peptidase [Pustulibacterium marinum]SFU48921.1 protease-4 [Pustulibacterium marinum]
MKVNGLLHDIAKGQWAMSLEGYMAWAPVAYKILTGKSELPELEAAKLITFYGDQGNELMPDEEGAVDVSRGAVAVVNIIGPMIKYGDWCVWGADEISKKIKGLYADPNIKGIVIVCDGPGGAVGGIPYYKDLARYKNKPLGIVYDTMCSAHLWGMYAMKPDFVWAANDISAQVGSMGIMISLLDNRKYLTENGISIHDIYADESSDKNQPFIQALNGEYDLIKAESLNPLARKFQSEMLTLRPSLKKEVPGVITGKVFFTDQALEYGFADGVGTVEEAIERVEILSEIN